MSPRIWLMAARPRTLPAAIAPVLVGTAAAVEASEEIRVGPFIAALIGSIFIQIGTNLANDYSDAKRGADTADRLGPVPVTSSGLVAPRRVLHAAYLARVRGRGRRRDLPRHGRGPGDPRRRRRVDRRRRALHRRAPPLRLRRHGRAVRVPVLRPGRRQRLLLRPARRGSTGWPSRSRSRSGCSRRRSWSSTTSARTDRRAAKRTLAVRLGREPTRRLHGRWSEAPRCSPSGSWRPTDRRRRSPCCRPRWRSPRRARCAEDTGGPSLSRALARTGALLEAFSLLLTAGLLLAA